MIRVLTAAPLALLVAVALLSGCGSSSSNSSATATTSTPSTSSSTSPPANTTHDTAAAVAQCKRGVSVLPTLPQATKRRLESICQKAAGGDAKAARAAAREACEEIVKASPLPAGSARNRALAGCKSAERK
jgi:hypothetical protein